MAGVLAKKCISPLMLLNRTLSAPEFRAQCFYHEKVRSPLKHGVVSNSGPGLVVNMGCHGNGGNVVILELVGLFGYLTTNTIGNMTPCHWEQAFYVVNNKYNPSLSALERGHTINRRSLKLLI